MPMQGPRVYLKYGISDGHTVSRKIIKGVVDMLDYYKA